MLNGTDSGSEETLRSEGILDTQNKVMIEKLDNKGLGTLIILSLDRVNPKVKQKLRAQLGNLEISNIDNLKEVLSKLNERPSQNNNCE